MKCYLLVFFVLSWSGLFLYFTRTATVIVNKMNRKEKFNASLLDLYNKKANNSKLYSKSSYKSVVERLITLRANGPSSAQKSDYYFIKHFDLQRVDAQYILLSKKSGKILACMGDLFDNIKESHQSTLHGGRQVTTKLINQKYSNITQEIVLVYCTY